MPHEIFTLSKVDTDTSAAGGSLWREQEVGANRTDIYITDDNNPIEKLYVMDPGSGQNVDFDHYDEWVEGDGSIGFMKDETFAVERQADNSYLLVSKHTKSFDSEIMHSILQNTKNDLIKI